MWTSENRQRYNRDKLRYPSDLTDDEWSLAHSGDLERSFRSITNTDSGDHEHPHEPA